VKHKHHIVPKHAGGTDDPSNLVEVSVTQHAMFHYCEWRLHGRWEDKCAWQVLANNVKHPLHVKGRKLTDSQRKDISERMKGNTHGAVPCSEEKKEKLRKSNTGKKLTEETKEKLREINVGRKHTEESKKKCSEAGKKGGRKKGSIPWNKGVRKNETTIG
jgi:hypothetical protein